MTDFLKNEKAAALNLSEIRSASHEVRSSVSEKISARNYWAL
ncbi:hypothetical protein [Desulfonema magnum]|uniref:Uncharacterized protein n=1 Tax=Desulfonema magnum TaxID=45655 RepID=A0A975BSQ0_9BACT|nr:hypothetical protein [Desulfonema magnum]QTA90976.1 Uncharacterized protein dnm_070400 [Desulfonema magnum]